LQQPERSQRQQIGVARACSDQVHLAGARVLPRGRRAGSRVRRGPPHVAVGRRSAPPAASARRSARSPLRGRLPAPGSVRGGTRIGAGMRPAECRWAGGGMRKRITFVLAWFAHRCFRRRFRRRLFVGAVTACRAGIRIGFPPAERRRIAQVAFPVADERPTAIPANRIEKQSAVAYGRPPGCSLS
jgi:hypothetical protein